MLEGAAGRHSRDTLERVREGRDIPIDFPWCSHKIVKVPKEIAAGEGELQFLRSDRPYEPPVLPALSVVIMSRVC